jgi:hypothetical protein
LASLAPAGRAIQLPVVDRLLKALREEDVRGLQELGGTLLLSNPEAIPPFLRDALPRILAGTLEKRPNTELLAFLKSFPSALIEQVPTVPATWAEATRYLRRKDWKVVARFLELDNLSFDARSTDELRDTVEGLEEIFTDPVITTAEYGRSVAFRMLVKVIEELRLDNDFPRIDLSDTYSSLLALWVQQKAGSAHRADTALFLLLGWSVLELRAGAEGEIVAYLGEWWARRKAFALLQFLLEGLDLVTPFLWSDATKSDCQGLWFEGATLSVREPDSLSPCEKSAWRALGYRLGIDVALVDQVLLPFEQPSDTELPDLLKEAELSKIAIVSRQEKQAEEAARQIALRCKAKIVIAKGNVAGAETDNAKTADIILLVASTISHAVYRAFDDVRDRIAYVQGTGSASIVLALERALHKRKQLDSTTVGGPAVE